MFKDACFEVCKDFDVNMEVENGGNVEDGDKLNVDNGYEDMGQKDFDNALKDSETPLYTGRTEFTKISVVIALYKYKA